MIGQTIGHYQIVEKLGEGGMGVVYKATDTKLDRVVALKFLPDHVSAGSDELERFIQEAKAAAGLNHPNICTIHGIEEADKKHFIVMEFVDGQTLQAKKSTLSIKEALDVGIQIAEGLAAAHEKGIVHRDIKPENIMFRKDGRVQIMDFGLAKLRGASRLTKEGSTVGTAGYMSPEQVQGKDTDHRSDIFSLGVLLFEMLTGQPPFKGVHETAIAYEIVNVDSAPMSSVRPGIAPELDAVVLECLEKDPKERTQSASQVAVDLKRYQRGSSRERISRTATTRTFAEPQMASGPSTRLETILRARRAPWVVAGVLMIALTTVGTLYLTQPSPDRAVVRAILLPPGNSVYTSYLGGGHFALSPDGLKLVYMATDSSGNSSLWIRPLNSLEAEMLPGTVGASFPFWSPDGRSIGFFGSGKLKKILATGGPSFSICDVIDPRGGTWNRDGIIVFAATWNSGLSMVSADGGDPSPVTRLDSTRRDQTHRWPWFLPDGKHFLYFTRTGTGGEERENDAIIVSSLDGSVNKRLLSASSNVAYSSGYLLFVRQTALVAQPFDPANLALTDDAVPVVGQIGYDLDFNRGAFTVSDNGIFSYRGNVGASGTQLILFDRTGRKLRNVGERAQHGGGQLSRDERKLVISEWDPQSRNRDLWAYDLVRNVRSRFTFDPVTDDDAVWSSDGTAIIYTSEMKTGSGIYRKAIGGAGGEDLLVESALTKRPRDVSRDGRFLLYYVDDPKTGSDVWVLPLTGETKPFPLVQSEFDEYDPQFSPDGKWISYTSNESGVNEVYVIPFGPSGAGTAPKEKWQITNGGVHEASLTTARWRADGKELFYVSKNARVMAVDLKISGASLEVGVAKELFQLRSGFPIYVVAASADGQRFLLSCRPDQSSTPLTLVLNWDEEMRTKSIGHR